MREQFAEDEAKGQYCRFVPAGNGKLKLEPVKVPAHVKAERAERIRRRELRQRVEQNRARAQALNRRSVLFLAIAMVICCGVCCVYLNLRSTANSRMGKIVRLQEAVETITSDNDLKEQRLLAKEDLNAIRREAVERFGMHEAGPDRIVYYSVDYQDYMLQYRDVD